VIVGPIRHYSLSIREVDDIWREMGANRRSRWR